MDPNKLKSRFTLIGFLVGLCFPLIAIIIDILFKGIGFSLASIAEIHEINPILFLIDIAPLVLAVVAYLIGGNFARLRETSLDKIARQEKKISKYAEYTENLINGKYDQSFDFGEEESVLVSSLSKLKETLMETEERERRQLWTSEGLARFIEVLRSDRDNLNTLAARIISNLVQYLEANQGGIFVVEEVEGENVLQMLSAYAYDKERFLQKHIKPGEGLVGQAFKEGEKIFLTDIPKNYLNITSGLGESMPKCLLIVPLILNEEVYGVLELASFNIFAEHEIEFVEKLSDNIAATISGIKVAERTSSLLKESQMNTEQMRSQEEEMRQNMEELTATQEELQRKELEYQQRIEDLETKLKKHEKVSS